MVQVAWNISTKRGKIFEECHQGLTKFQKVFARPLNPEYISKLNTEKILELLSKESNDFASDYLYWPFVLVILTESTMQNLRQITTSIFGELKSDQKIREWMAKGLHTVTLEMQAEYMKACENEDLREQFLARYGHRGPGEMDLSNPRWFEMKEEAFVKINSIFF